MRRRSLLMSGCLMAGVLAAAIWWFRREPLPIWQLSVFVAGTQRTSTLAWDGTAESASRWLSNALQPIVDSSAAPVRGRFRLVAPVEPGGTLRVVRDVVIGWDQTQQFPAYARTSGGISANAIDLTILITAVTSEIVGAACENRSAHDEMERQRRLAVANGR